MMNVGETNKQRRKKMKIRGLTRKQLDGVLVAVNDEINSPGQVYYSETPERQGNFYKLRLTVLDKQGPYGNMHSPAGRPSGSMCGHGFYAFYKHVFQVNENASIRTGSISTGKISYDGEEDFNKKWPEFMDQIMGSAYTGMSRYSDLCECSESEIEIALKSNIILQVDQSRLTSDCWMIQVFGIHACSGCEVKDTDECGGKGIIAKIRKREYPYSGIGQRAV
jgi:hypothetical protein